MIGRVHIALGTARSAVAIVALALFLCTAADFCFRVCIFVFWAKRKHAHVICLSGPFRFSGLGGGCIAATEGAAALLVAAVLVAAGAGRRRRCGGERSRGGASSLRRELG